jgi:hypothetical protein
MKRDVMHSMRVCPVLCAAMALAVANDTQANINLELRPAFQSTFVGNTVSLDLYAVSSTLANESFGSAQMILTWNTTFVQLLGLDNTGSALLPSGASAFIGGDPFGLNASMTDGDALWNGFAFAGGVVVTPALSGGTFLTSFDFLALNPTVLPTLVDIPATGGNGGFTAVYSGTGPPYTNVTGTLTGGLIEILIPGPGALAGLLGGILIVGRRGGRARMTR